MHALTVKSKIDVITNSSTEVYLIADQSSIRSIKNLVNEFLKLGGKKDLDFDDLFDVEINFAEWLAEEYYCEGWWKEEKEFKSWKLDKELDWDDLTLEQKKEWARTMGDPVDDSRGPFFGAGLTFTAKDPEYSSLADLLNNIENIYSPEIYSN